MHITSYFSLLSENVTLRYKRVCVYLVFFIDAVVFNLVCDYEERL